MATYNMLEARDQLSRLVAAAEAGEDVTIARRGVPVVRVVPLGRAADDAGERLVDWLERNPLPAGAGRSSEEIEAAIRAEREAWE
ncbi:type II toxin-antitoxin system prevent-host-death family antitoxin [Miniimonas sp. S16]|uniref:type II toxin-antitoxin system prevent-host-death family antitoxin n=1 Tax=Miniimonas sp. S16 TaxID=2171623 RepID=UPI000D5283BB|nr:type II toxin-antitoxin system prevent-host-death family antitoxin [Miniimonas sp. S16]